MPAGESKLRTHFASSELPLKEGRDIKAMCGEKVPKASFKTMQDTDWHPYVGYGVNCLKCNRKKWDGRFLYVISSGQEARDAE
jgi:hypothetical protein